MGRWNQTEHEQFLQGLAKYGRDWKAIATDIPTRSVVQVRTHAQKYFQKLSSNNPRSVLMSSKRARDYSFSRRYEEPENREPSETSGTTSPSETDTTGTSIGTSVTAVATVATGAGGVIGVTGISKIATGSASSGVAASSGSSGTVKIVATSRSESTTLPHATSPISLHLPDFASIDFEFPFFISRNRPYQSLSPFETECNNNQDDMNEVDSNMVFVDDDD